MSTQDVLASIKDEDIDYVDLRFTDPRGKWQHLTMCADAMDEDKEKAKNLGFKNYITKPIDVPLFVDLIEKYLK